MINKMVERLDRHAGSINVRAILERQDWENKHLKIVLETADTSIHGLVASAIKFESATMSSIDDQIADRIKALRGLQNSYEALVNRKVMIERLHLQNALLKRDLSALDVLAIDRPDGMGDDPADESTKATRKRGD